MNKEDPNKEKKYSVVTNPPLEQADIEQLQSNRGYTSKVSRETNIERKEKSLEVPKMLRTPELFSRKLP